MNENKKTIWITTGYELFALQGPNNLKVEAIAKKTGKSKSSFYHYFGDLELFIEELLDYHIQQSHVIAKKEQAAKCIDPELINILIEHRADLLFSRQLRINQQVKPFFDTLQQSNLIVGNAFVSIWVKELELTLSKEQIAGIFSLALENFYLQINEQNLNKTWLSSYFNALKKITSHFSAPHIVR
ncbi:MAG: TetR/AcrR family transcriptional regulator [Bacteroidia bacterium]|jgi:AcrR family transcriptional regulator|nr:TetR/AcrR family transcriptional regulator [Bacteroidia bacterium]